MVNLQLAVKGEYFDVMKRGEKTEEFRLVALLNKSNFC